jgi:CheY-like chemotaxis protein
VTTANSTSAAAKILDRGDKFDVVLSDIVMEGGGTSGLELAQSLRNTHPDLPVVLITGYSEALARANFKDVPVLFKPFTQQELITTITAALAQTGARARFA